jgi:hypothetical protein
VESVLGKQCLPKETMKRKRVTTPTEEIETDDEERAVKRAQLDPDYEVELNSKPLRVI